MNLTNFQDDGIIHIFFFLAFFGGITHTLVLANKALERAMWEWRIYQMNRKRRRR